MRKIISLDKGWKFKKEKDISQTGLDDYFNMFNSDAKTGMTSDARGNGYYDGDWEDVNLPDDWDTREKADPAIQDAGHGRKPQGAVWYRKNFSFNYSLEEKRVFLKIEAAAIHSTVWLNSIKIAQSESGYTPILVEVTDFIRCDRQNCLSVRCDNSVKEGWWYEGGGIYANTYFIITEKELLKEYDTFVRSQKTEKNVWQLKIDVGAEVIDNTSEIEIEAPELGIKEAVTAKENNSLVFDVKNPECWDITNPKLYEVKITLKKNGCITDEKTVKHGFRKIMFDSEKGFFLNDRSVKLNGVCIHHDFSGIGVAVPYEIQRYRIKRLKDMGCNAIRTSHNPQPEGFYRACDEFGMLVMNEVRHFSSTEEGLYQLKTFICRDRNHPSVILWSMFNEEPLQCTDIGRRMAQSMKDLINSLDGTRLVCGGMNGPMEIEGVVKIVDVMGFNYIQYEYDEFHSIYPDIPILGSENCSYLTTRDTVKTEMPYLSSFGDVLYENLYKWSANIGDSWKIINERAFVAGGFDWTGFDYRGECGGYPATVCNFGAMDLCGFPKGAYYWHKVIWNDEPQIYLSPYWDYTTGERVKMVCYSNCEYIEIYLNNKMIYSGEHDKYEMSIFEAEYEPGEIKAVGYTDKKAVAGHSLLTPGKERKLILKPYRAEIGNRHDDWDIINVYMTDENENIVHTASDEVVFEVINGKIIGIGNGDICYGDVENCNHIKLFHGCAQIIVGGDKDFEVIAKSDAIVGKCSVKVSADDDMEYILNEAPKIEIAPWRQSDVQAEYIEEEFIGDLMFSWIPTSVGYGKNLLYSGKHGFSQICGQIVLGDNMKDKNPSVVFEEIQGDVDIYFNRELVGQYKNEKNVRIPIDTEKYAESLIISVVFRLDGKDCGLTGNVYVC